MILHVFGDSHSAYCFDGIKEASINWLGPVTMHRVARDGPSFVTSLVRDPKASDVIVLMFGEIDIRTHLIPVAERTGRAVELEAQELAVRYVRRIAELKDYVKGATLVVAEPPFPSKRRPNAELPFAGTLAQRVLVHSAVSNALRQTAEAHGISFLRMPRRYATKSGSLKRIYSDDGVHIMPCEAKAYASAVSNLLGRRVRFRRSSLDIFLRRWNYVFGGPLRRRGLPKTRRLTDGWQKAD